MHRITESIEHLSQKVLRRSQEIHPHLLQDVDLLATLNWYLNGLNLQTHLEASNISNRLPNAVEHCIYRVVQVCSAFSTTFCHVALWQDHELLHVSIEIDPAFQHDWNNDPNPILLMQEQTRIANGTLDVQFDETVGFHFHFPNIMPITEDHPAEPLSNQTGLNNLGEFRYLFALGDPMLSVMMSNFFQEHIPSASIDAIGSAELSVETFQRSMPDILVIDIINDMDTSILCSAKTLFLSAYDSPAYIHKLLTSGIKGVVLKSHLLADIIPALEAILVGHTYVSPVAEFDLDSLPRHENETASQPFDIQQILTTREIEIMERLLADRTHLEIAEDLVISHRTVEKHRANLMQKLGLKTQTELVLFAVRHGIISS